MFRHFFCDPDPARIMRDTAPGVQEWVARMWNMRPQRFSSAAQVEAIADDLHDLLAPVVSAYLPYLLANQQAVIAGQEQVTYRVLGADWNEPTKPYRLWCLDRLRSNFQSLDKAASARVADVLDSVGARENLSTSPTGHSDHLVGTLPYAATADPRPISDSWGR
jgi:hypothetical protein